MEEEIFIPAASLARNSATNVKMWIVFDSCDEFQFDPTNVKYGWK